MRIDGSAGLSPGKPGFESCRHPHGGAVKAIVSPLPTFGSPSAILLNDSHGRLW